MKFRKPIKKKSDKKKLREECGKLQLEILKLKRGLTCQIDGRAANGLGRFHILDVGQHPRLEFVEENILLVNWLPHHFLWHHSGQHDPRCKYIVDKIKQICGENYYNDLLTRERFMSKHDTMYLLVRIAQLKQELKSLC